MTRSVPEECDHQSYVSIRTIQGILKSVQVGLEYSLGSRIFYIMIFVHVGKLRIYGSYSCSV